MLLKWTDFLNTEVTWRDTQCVQGIKLSIGKCKTWALILVFGFAPTYLSQWHQIGTFGVFLKMLQYTNHLCLHSMFFCFLLCDALFILCSALVCSFSAQSPSLSCRCCRHVCAPGRDTHYTALLEVHQYWAVQQQLLSGKALPYCMGSQRLDVCLQVWVGARRDRSGRRTDRWIWMVLPSPQISQYPPINWGGENCNSVHNHIV